MDRYLFLDIATNTGYAIYDVKSSMVIQHGSFKAHTKDNWGKGLKEFEQWMNGVILEYDIKGIIAEETYIPFAGEHKNTKAFKRLCELHGILEKVCFEKELPINFVEPKHHHVNLCGWNNRNRKDIKEETVKRIKCLFGKFFVENDDEADALSIMLFWLKFTKFDLILPNGRLFS